MTTLTDRERQVLQLLADGLEYREMAEKLHLTLHTIKGCLGSLYAKMGVTKAPAAVSVGYQWGLLDVADGLGDDLVLLRTWRAAGYRLAIVPIRDSA